MQVWLNDKYYNVSKEFTIFQFCALKGINLPCFCYYEKLTIVGNCRICLVEVNTAINLVISCAMPLLNNMRIYTMTKRVRKGREGVLEFLLSNHPLDCPICDQGGECDLQDLSLTVGSDKGRFYEQYKRAVDNLNFAGPLIKTVMTRCIHCTRCVRFMQEITANYNFGIIGRGASMEIGTYINTFISDELLGNIIDLCPVGALTSMPYAFTARSWEINKYNSIDILDAMGSSIRIDVVNNKVVRILPSLNETLNEE
jgi:NADH dehydrogenase (ubiquinone) Fe-S protein 1